MENVEAISGAVEATGSGVKALCNLLSNLYEPRKAKKLAIAESEGIKLKADAKAYEFNTLCKTLRDNGINIDTENSCLLLTDENNKHTSILGMANNRELNNSIRKEENLENILSKTYVELEGKEVKSSETVDNDWMTRFIDISKNISNGNLQLLWGRILANEIIEPTSYSLRTLDILQNITTKEAILFQKACNFILDGSFLYNSSKDFKNYDIKTSELVLLSEYGLIHSDSLLNNGTKIKALPMLITMYGSYVLMCNSSSTKEINYGVFPLTSAGKELYKIIECSFSKDYFIDFAKDLASKEKKATFAIYKIITYTSDMDLKFHH